MPTPTPTPTPTPMKEDKTIMDQENKKIKGQEVKDNLRKPLEVEKLSFNKMCPPGTFVTYYPVINCKINGQHTKTITFSFDFEGIDSVVLEKGDVVNLAALDIGHVELHKEPERDMNHHYERLEKQAKFFTEMTKLKQVNRENNVINSFKNESSVEHMNLFVILFGGLMSDFLDQLKVMKMVTIHDLVQVYSKESNKEKGDNVLKEEMARKLAKTLPNNQAKEFLFIWKEFENGKTMEAIFAREIDRLQPFLLIYFQNGREWVKNKTTLSSIIKKYKMVEDIAPHLWGFLESLIQKAVKQKWIIDDS